MMLETFKHGVRKQWQRCLGALLEMGCIQTKEEQV